MPAIISYSFSLWGGKEASLSYWKKYLLDMMFLLLMKELAVLSSLHKSCASPWATAQGVLAFCCTVRSSISIH